MSTTTNPPTITPRERTLIDAAVNLAEAHRLTHSELLDAHKRGNRVIENHRVGRARVEPCYNCCFTIEQAMAKGSSPQQWFFARHLSISMHWADLLRGGQAIMDIAGAFGFRTEEFFATQGESQIGVNGSFLILHLHQSYAPLDLEGAR